MKRLLKSVISKAGFDVVRVSDSGEDTIADLDLRDQRIVELVAPYTMTSLARRASVVQAVDHVVRNGVPGDIVECGVWRGGSMMAAALALTDRGVTDRDLWLYDTFEGMTEPTDVDRDTSGLSARSQYVAAQEANRGWCAAGLEDVTSNLAGTGYPVERVHLIEGKVEDTIPARVPDEIAVLRLDTDWYESTRHEMEHLYPRLTTGGVLIIDDYGHWQGARRAVDEYFEQLAGPVVYLHRVDYTARAMVKP